MNNVRSFWGRRILLSVTALFTLLSSVSLLQLSAQKVKTAITKTTVGTSPAEVVVDPLTHRVHLFSIGTDAGFDGIYNPGDGDIAASWTVLDTNGSVIRTVSFNTFFNTVPVHVGLDPVGKILYAPVDMKVKAYNLETMELMEDSIIYDDSIDIVTYDPISGYLLMSRRDASYFDPGKILVMDLDEKRVIGELKSGVNPGMALDPVIDPDRQLLRYYTINEGDGGPSRNASLTMFGYSSDIYRALNNRAMGGTVTQARVYDGKAYILMAGAGMVRIIDIATQEETSNSPITFNPGLEARSIATSNGILAITGRAGRVELFNVASGTALPSVTLPGRGLGSDIVGTSLFVALPDRFDSFDGDSTVAVFNVLTQSSNTITTKPRPLWIHGLPSENAVLVVGAGDFTGTWWELYNATTRQKISEGEIATANLGAFGTAFDTTTNTLAVAVNNSIVTVNVLEETPALHLLHTEPGVTYGWLADQGEYWLATTVPGDFAPEPSFVHAIDKETGERVASAVVGENTPTVPIPAISQVDGAIAAMGAPYGTTASPVSWLAYVEYHPNLFEGELGITPNHITRVDTGSGERDATVITMNGSHELVFLKDVATNPSIASRISTGTSGFDGPRTTVYGPKLPGDYAGSFLVTSYTGKLLVIRDGMVRDSIDLGAKGEGIVLAGPSKAMVPLIFQEGTYIPDSNVAIITFSLDSGGSGVREESVVAGLTTWPNPAREHATVSMTIERPSTATINLYDMTGRLVQEIFSGKVETGTRHFNIPLTSLAAGSYLISIETEQGHVARQINVVR